MSRLQCGVSWPDGALCNQWLDSHVHTPLPCEFGNDERHHEFVPARWSIEREWIDLLATLTALAPILSRRQRVTLRKALLVREP